MLLKYLPVNQSWAFVYGDAIVRIGDEPSLFGKLSDALKAAERHGLLVVNGKVSAKSN